MAKRHGVIVIEDPDDPSKLSVCATKEYNLVIPEYQKLPTNQQVIPAAGQLLDSWCWKPHKGFKNPKKKSTYDPSL